MLTSEEIDRLDIEALKISETNGRDWMRAFADLVTAAEREACAKRVRALENGPDCGDSAGYMRALEDAESAILMRANERELRGRAAFRAVPWRPKAGTNLSALLGAGDNMSISERIRPGIEAAPWVCEEVGKLEAAYEALRADAERYRWLRDAVVVRRECHKAYSDFSIELNKLKRMPTREEYAKEVAMRSALGAAERAVMDAAELLTPNDPGEPGRTGS